MVFNGNPEAQTERGTNGTQHFHCIDDARYVRRGCGRAVLKAGTRFDLGAGGFQTAVSCLGRAPPGSKAVEVGQTIACRFQFDPSLRACSPLLDVFVLEGREADRRGTTWRRTWTVVSDWNESNPSEG
jgi:hypothetical protein